MAGSEEAIKYNEVTDILLSTFGEVIHRDTIYSIVESCSGDLNQAANAIMSITSDDNSEPVSSRRSPYSPSNSSRSMKKKKSNKHKNNSSAGSTSAKETNWNLQAEAYNKSSPKMSYAGAFATKKKEKTPRKHFKSHIQDYQKFMFHSNSSGWSEQIKRIIEYHNQGIRTLVIMRGAPGSGKSYLARQIQEMTVGAETLYVHIYSSDEFFTDNGFYKYDKKNLQNAHVWNQHRAFNALGDGISPIIIDNTNIEGWEIQPYANAGVNNGYMLEVVEPNTVWARNLSQLASRNKHGVPLSTIKRMLELLAIPITAESLMANFNLVYPKDMNPPVIRKAPKLSDKSTIKNRVIAIQKEPEDDDLNSSDEDNIYTSIRMTKVPVDAKEQRGHTVKKEEDSGKMISEMKTQKMSCDVISSDDQIVTVLETEDKESLNGKVKTLNINGDQNTISKPELIDEYKAKNMNVLDKDQCLDNKMEQKDFSSIQNVQQASDFIQSKEDELKLEEASKCQTSTCIEISNDQVNVEKLLDEFQKVENEWDNGEAWEENNNTSKKEHTTDHKGSPQSNTSINAKSPRNRKIRENVNCLQDLGGDNDWRKMYTPMLSVTDINNQSLTPSINVVETKFAETCVEIGDTDTCNVKNGFKICDAVARDINLNYVPNLPEKIPENRKFDKSSMTNEITIMSGVHRCRNEDKHFTRFRNMFKHLKKDDLRDIFDNCCGDVNWAVSIVIDDMPNNHSDSLTVDEQSEVEEDSDEPCYCECYYGVIPDVTATNIKDEHLSNDPSSSVIRTDTSNTIRKQKKESLFSNSSLALKRQIEKNIVISDQHYSEECLKVRKMRRGILDDEISNSQNIKTGITMQNTNQLDAFSTLSINTGNRDTDTQIVSGPSNVEVANSEGNSDDESVFDEVEKTVNINLGHAFLRQLDSLFGRGDMNYSDTIEPKVNMPLSMLNEINALWMESLMSQLEAESRTHEQLIKQDEEFARELALEQLEIMKSGREPEVPNLKEIMDMEYALSLYRKDCDELMQKDRPTDWAAKLSEKKLYDLFPEIPSADLDEILMAHHYEFRATVGVLLQTQGRIDITKEENGVDKFIMAKELERQKKFLAAERKRLLEQKLPNVPSTISMEMVNDLRNKAKVHLANWNKNYGKAKYMVKKNADIAHYYNSLAGLHLLKYEQANSVAAASLLHIHARKSGSDVTLDLHYLYVEESKAALDVFLDTHIERLRMLKNSDKEYPALFIITGRGLHSRGGPKIKPAVEKHLRSRGLTYKELNPGLLSVKISVDNVLSYQVL